MASLIIQSLEADLQSNVGKFLQMKSYLVRMKASKDPNEVKKATILYDAQVKLEADMTVALDKIKIIKNGAYTFSDIRKIATFVFELKSHMKEVTAFLSGKKMPSIGVPMPMLGMGLGALALVWFMRR